MEDDRIIDYLYGEMSDREKADFESELVDNDELKRQLLALQNVRKALGELEDKDMVTPSFNFKHYLSHQTWIYSTAFQWVSAIAAGLLLLLISAYLLNVSVQTTREGMQIGLGMSNALPVDNELTKEDVKLLMQEVMEEMDDQTDSKLVALEKRLVTKIDSQDVHYTEDIQRLFTRYSQNTDQLMRNYVAQVNDKNKQMIESFFEVSSDTQQEYVQSVLADFNEFYQNQRSYDLEVIETSIDLMRNNYNVKQLEQDNLLANLYSMVQTQSR